MLKLIAFTSDTHVYDVSDRALNEKESPLFVTVDSINGSKIIRKLVLSNISQNKKHVNTTIAVDTSLEELQIPENITIKLIASETKPNEADFDNIETNFNTVAIDEPIMPNKSITIWLFVRYPGALALDLMETVDVTLDNLIINVHTTEEAV